MLEDPLPEELLDPEEPDDDEPELELEPLLEELPELLEPELSLLELEEELEPDSEDSLDELGDCSKNRSSSNCWGK